MERLNIKDEILSEEPKYRIRDKSGNILYDNLIIEQITPVQQMGTPLNKALFDKIDNNFLKEFSERSRIDKYNNCIFEKVDEKIEEDIIPKQWTKNSNTEFVSGNFKITTANIYSSSSNILKEAFDGDINTGARYNQFLCIDFGTQIRIRKLRTYVATNFKVQASNDNSTWNDLTGEISSQSNLEEINLNNSNFYRYYRVYNTTSTSTYYYCYEIQVAEHGGIYSLFKINNSDFEGIDNYINNSILNIKIPNNEVISTENILPRNWSAVTSYTSYKSGDFEISASGYYSTNYPANYAVDNSTGTRWRDNSKTSSYLIIKLDKARRITKFKTFIVMRTTGTWKIQGSNDNSTWNDLFVTTESDAELTEHELTNTGVYQYYRVYSELTSSSFTDIYELQISEHYRNFLDFIEYPVYLAINNLEPKELKISGIPTLNDKYELFYNENKWIAIRKENNVSVKVGSISNDGIIPKTEGYKYYAYFVSLRSGTISVSISVRITTAPRIRNRN